MVDLLWVGLVVANLNLWFWSGRDNLQAQALLDETLQLIDKHERELAEDYKKADNTYRESLRLFKKSEALLASWKATT